MIRSPSERRARVTAVVNGLLVFGVPTAFLLLTVVSAWDQPWPAEFAEFRPGRREVLLEALELGLVFAALGAVAAWRTGVHARRFISGGPVGWSGIAEAAVCGFVVASLYLTPGIVTRPREAPPYVIFYGTAAAIIGAVVGLALHTSARVLLGILPEDR